MSSSESSWEDASESEVDKHFRLSVAVAREAVRLVLGNEIEGTSNPRPRRSNKERGGVKGLSPLQKCTSAIRQLAYESAADSIDEYLRMSETTSRECLDSFCQGIIHLYRQKYLRKPTVNDVQAFYALHDGRHGLPSMLSSIDCMHWYRKNCPVT
ncbi:hypothetical protein OSB04_019245 [Centaurea solstitialis]|uniref:Uncharacterized protein n=1 Tax=Centaurea solstitialis TaxID=347529 RepID=A0AA38T8E8_9ASTR|nr:hypothetical protein OSB04_019245 [Centaurea solstitialis]